jgi:hypothetical protein
LGWPLLGQDIWARLDPAEQSEWVIRPRGRPTKEAIGPSSIGP